MPPAIYTQNVIAVVWDFDKTLTWGYMQDPLFHEYGVDASQFWKEVNSLPDHYRDNGGYAVSADTVYLNHILAYVRNGVFADLTRAKLKELGKEITLAPGLPEFFDRMRAIADDGGSYQRHEIRIEHYIVSTGLKAMIQGSAIADKVDGIWACELLPASPSPGYLDRLSVSSETLADIGYTIDNTSKTRALFEINKGVNVQDGTGVTVNSSIPHDLRRVPFPNMIYIADGPSDIPCFSVVNSKAGRTLGVYAGGENLARNYESAAQLQEQGRVNSIAPASYEFGSAAEMWIDRAIRKIADDIVSSRERVLSSLARAPGHVV